MESVVALTRNSRIRLRKTRIIPSILSKAKVEVEEARCGPSAVTSRSVLINPRSNRKYRRRKIEM